MKKLVSAVLCVGAVAVAAPAGATNYPLGNLGATANVSLGQLAAGETKTISAAAFISGSYQHVFQFFLTYGSLNGIDFTPGIPSKYGNPTISLYYLDAFPYNGVNDTLITPVNGDDYANLNGGYYGLVLKGTMNGNNASSQQSYTLTLKSIGQPVPGPGAWLIGIGAFGALGFAARRKALNARPSRMTFSAA